MGRRKERKMGDKGTMKALALASQFGFAVAGPLLLFIGGGVWADNQFGTKPWLFFVGLILGLLSAAAALYQVATSQSKESSRPARNVTKREVLGDQTHRGTSRADEEQDR